ncbi:MAG: DUF1592 domain-containing protein [Archangiaceae bacterium]|nr:DUF1592 domain-containing protein [Archangiaceae bacterium]
MFWHQAKRVWLTGAVLALTACEGMVTLPPEGTGGGDQPPGHPPVILEDGGVIYPDEDAGVDPDPDGGTVMPPTFTCSPPTSTETVDIIAADFASKVHPKLMDAANGCISCHSANSARAFKVSSNARQTFDNAYVSGLFTRGMGGLLARLTETDALARMPQGKPAWPTPDIANIADISCRLEFVSTPTVCASGDIKPGVSPLRRLNRREYGNTVQVVAGITDRPGDAQLPDDLHVEGWPDNDADLLTVGSAHIRGFESVAEDLSARLTTDLPGFLKCATPTDACAKTFLTDDFGQRAFRRPLTAAEKTRFQTLFTSARAMWTLKEAVMVVVEAVLQSPPFLYRIEATATPLSKPSSYEMASRLSYLYLQGPPDATLLSLAASDQLQDPAVIAAQARRLIADPRAKVVVANFHKQWLGFADIANVSKNTTAFPMWSDSLRPLMQKETELFVDAVFWDDTSHASDLIDAPYSYLNKQLADFYGATGPTNATFVKVTLPTNRAGILGHGSILATQALEDQTHPVYRGNFVLTRLLGQVLGAPPATDASGNPIDLPPLDPTKTTRERFAAHSSNAACAGCHKKIDPIGFSLENFDGTGRWQTTQAGKTIDPSGTLTAPAGVAGPVANGREMMARVAASPEYQRTLLQRWFALGAGRTPGVSDACSLERLETAFNASGKNLKNLFTLLSTTDAFLYRGTAP